MVRAHFLPEMSILTGSNYPGGITVADLNNNSRTQTSSQQTARRQRTFPFSSISAAEISPRRTCSAPGLAQVATDVAVADMNGDGFVDLATSSSNSTASVLLGDGIGNFGTAQLIPISGVASSGVRASATSTKTAVSTLAVSNTTSNNISVLINDSVVTGADPNASGDLDISDVDFGEAKFAAVTAGDLKGPTVTSFSTRIPVSGVTN